MPTFLPRRALTAGALAAALCFGGVPDAPAQAQFRVADALVTAENNAALRYWRAFALVNDDLNALLGEAASTLDAPTFDATPELRKAVADAENAIDQLLLGAALPDCDFGIDRQLGIGALLPHLQPMRNGARLLLADARLRVASGDQVGAAERIAAAFRMADHAARDEFVISSLVGVSMWNQSRLVTERLLDAGELNADARATIRRTLLAFPAGDPFHAEAALRGEAEALVVWLREQVNESDNAGELVEALGGVDAGFDTSTVRALDKATMQSHTDLMRAAYVQLLEAWNAPDPKSAFVKVEEEVQRGAFGEFARLLLPSIGRYHRNVETAEADFAALRERLAE